MLVCCASLLPLQATTVKSISVSADAPFTDHVSMRNDATDMDLMVKFVFDEAHEQLTVSLISYRSLFVFRDDVRYSQVVGCGGKLHPEKLPYVATADKGQQFRIAKTLRRTIAKPHKRHIFRRWMSYDGLIPQPSEYAMVNDFIEQKFDIKNKQDYVEVTLRDVFLMDRDAKHANRYWLVFGRDMDTQYQITIERNPCFGQDSLILAAQQTLADVQKSFAPFHARYKDGKVTSDEVLAVFQKVQASLVQQFPSRTVQTACPELRQTWDAYNRYADSLRQMQCKVEMPSAKATLSGAAVGVNATFVMEKARQIDLAVGRWMASGDAAERRDIKEQCSRILSTVNAIIKSQGVYSDDQKKAVALFRSAEKYFNATCFPKKSSDYVE